MICKRAACKRKKLNFELPYNEWLFQLVHDKLTPLEFAVFERDKQMNTFIVKAIYYYIMQSMLSRIFKHYKLVLVS